MTTDTIYIVAPPAPAIDPMKLGEPLAGAHELAGLMPYIVAIRDASMNAVAPEGFHAIFVDAEAALDRWGGDPAALDGKLVVARHREDGDHIVRRAVHMGGGAVKLVTETRDPRWRGEEASLDWVIDPWDLSGQENSEFTLVGIVVAIFGAPS